MKLLTSAANLEALLAQAVTAQARLTSAVRPEAPFSERHSNDHRLGELEADIAGYQRLLQAPAQFAAAQHDVLEAQAVVQAARTAREGFAARDGEIDGETRTLNDRLTAAANRRGDHLEECDQVAAAAAQREIEGIKVEIEERNQRKGANQRKLDAATGSLAEAEKGLAASELRLRSWESAHRELESLRASDTLRLTLHALPAEIRIEALDRVHYELRTGGFDRAVQSLSEAQAAATKSRRRRQDEPAT